jgi:hypothetical protein
VDFINAGLSWNLIHTINDDIAFQISSLVNKRDDIPLVMLKIVVCILSLIVDSLDYDRLLAYSYKLQVDNQNI